ncbi:translin-associated factor X-interacting protein 1-like [Amphiura filiformis]|uniref:translin-associated factor X-interacting protein 1-like n=1 Tax=Amphiura filiformis TaxID=82378 RepID=UPI003B226BB6
MSAKTVAKLPPIPRSTPPAVGPTISSRSPKPYQGLHGPTYQISQTRHPLPDPQSLKPFVDTKSGSLDTWPAHATAQATAKPSLPSQRRRSTPDSILAIQDAEGDPNTSVVPKPKFLENLEVFLKKELRNVNGGRGGPSDLRLQAYREVFEYLIEDFKTYKPLLSAIKNEYELMLAQQREQIRELEPLKSMLVTVSEQCDQKVMALREQERQEMVDLRMENRRLLEKIDGMKQEHGALQAQIEKLQDEVAAEYLKYRDECDARKLLVSDINDLKYQQEDYQKAQAGGNQEVEIKEDPVKLKIALKKAREDLTDATQRLNEMIANYGDVVPRRDFEALQANHNKLQEEMDTLKADHGQLMEEHDTLLEVNKQVLTQRDEFYQELESLKRSATPRPEWDRCAQVLEGGEERWNVIAQEKKSDELVGILLREIMGDGVGFEWFEPRGMGEDVPVYLRFEDIKIRDRKLSKSDALNVIREIWMEKSKMESEREEPSSNPEAMDTFVLRYMRQRYGDDKTVADQAYNLHDAIERFAPDDEQFALFKGVLNKELDEHIYYQQMELLAKLNDKLSEKDAAEGAEGKLTKGAFDEALREAFDVKEEDNVAALVQAAEEELKAEGDDALLEYQLLFTEDEEGNSGPFLTKFRQQEKEEKAKYLDQIRKETGLEDEEEIPWGKLRMAINVIDAEIDKHHMLRYLAIAFDVEQDQLAQSTPQTIGNIMLRFQKAAIRRVGKLNSSELE